MRPAFRALAVVFAAIGFAVAHFLATALSLLLSFSGVLGPVSFVPAVLFAVLGFPAAWIIALMGGLVSIPLSRAIGLFVANSLLWSVPLVALAGWLIRRGKRALSSSVGGDLDRSVADAGARPRVPGHRPSLRVLVLAGCTFVAFIVVAVAGSKRVTMQTQGAESRHFWFPPGTSRLTSENTVAHDLTCAGTTVAVADIARGLSLYEHGSWRQPLSTVKPDVVPGYWRVVIQGQLAYALTIRGFDVIDISRPASASIAGSYLSGTENRANPLGDESTQEDSDLLGGLHERLDVRGAYAYLTDDQSNLQIIDIRDPASPTKVGVLPFGNPRAGLRLTAVAAGPDSLVYVGVQGISGHRGVEVVDVSTPTQPRSLSFTVTGHEPGLVLSHGMLFVVARYLGPTRDMLTIFRAGPRPAKVSELNLQGRSSRIVKICGKRVLIGYSKSAAWDRGYSGVELINIEDPARPKQVGKFSTPGLAQAAIITNGTTLIAGGVAGLLVRR